MKKAPILFNKKGILLMIARNGVRKPAPPTTTYASALIVLSVDSTFYQNYDEIQYLIINKD